MRRENMGTKVLRIATVGMLGCLMWMSVASAGVEPSPFLEGIFGFSDDDVWAVGELGKTWHFDGKYWKEIQAPTERDLTAVWGTEEDLWAVGEGALLQWKDGSWVMGLEPSPFLRAIWGPNSEEAWAVGDDGAVLRYIKGRWTTVKLRTKADLVAVWGTDSDNVWIVGEDGIILHFKNGEWVMGFGESPFLRAVWGTSDTDIWAVGDEGSMLHYDGRRWKSADFGVEKDLLGLYGLNSENIFAVGTRGTILKFDGNTWRPVASGTERDLYDIWLSEEGNPIAVGDGVIWTP